MQRLRYTFFAAVWASIVIDLYRQRQAKGVEREISASRGPEESAAAWSSTTLTLTTAALLAAIAGSWELYQNIYRHWQRYDGYRWARARADELERPLIVVGDPEAGSTCRWFGAASGYGDVCMDLTGCPGAPKGVERVGGDAFPALARRPANSAVVFVSFVLEYVEDPAAFYAEVKRVAGCTENLRVLTVNPYTFCALSYAEDTYAARWRIFGLEPTVITG